MKNPVICRLVITYIGGDMPPLQKLMHLTDEAPPLPCVIDDLGPEVLEIGRYRQNGVSGALTAECLIEENFLCLPDKAQLLQEQFIADGWEPVEV